MVLGAPGASCMSGNPCRHLTVLLIPALRPRPLSNRNSVNKSCIKLKLKNDFQIQQKKSDSSANIKVQVSKSYISNSKYRMDMSKPH